MAETPIDWHEAFDKLRAFDAEEDAILRALSALDPIIPADGEYHGDYCFFCGSAPLYVPVVEHTTDCPWARARKLFRLGRKWLVAREVEEATSMTTREYLYGYGSRRHIAKPWGENLNVRESTQKESFCSGLFKTEAGIRWRYASLGETDTQIQNKVDIKKALPVCKLCEARATKSGVVE